jgi:hypothetical protein
MLIGRDDASTTQCVKYLTMCSVNGRMYFTAGQSPMMNVVRKHLQTNRPPMLSGTVRRVILRASKWIQGA